MTNDERIHLLELVSGARSKLTALESAIAHLPEPAPVGPSPFPPVAPVAPPRAVVHIGTASAQKGKEAALEVRIDCQEPIAGVWVNLRHSPRLTFKNVTSKVKSRAFRVSAKGDHFQAVLMFTTDLETGSAVPPEVDADRTGVVQLAPDLLILEATYVVPADATPGQRFVVQGGRAGTGVPGVTSQSLPSRILNWGRGSDAGFEPAVEDGYVECVE